MPISGDIAGAGAALAGLILVFLGATSTSFDGYQRAEQNTVRGRYQRRAWFAFVGLTLSLVATLLSLVAQWLGIECLVLTALILLVVAMGWVLFAALLSVKDIT